MDCWFWNIDKGASDYFWSELQSGRLRQGWGYEDRLDLRRLQEKYDRKERVDRKEAECWDRCGWMVTDIGRGDLVVVKNVPSSNEFAIVKVTGEYDFEISEKWSDYGHILLVDPPRVCHKRASAVPSGMVMALEREQHPIRRTRKHHDAVIALWEREDIAELEQPEEFKDKLARWRSDLLLQLRDRMKETLTPRETERLVHELLAREGIGFSPTAGPTEAGADVIGTVESRYASPQRVAIQVKMHWGTDNDTRSVDQLERAFDAHHVDTGLLITTADKLGSRLESRIGQIKRERPIKALFGDELYGRVLELIADTEHEVE